MHIHVQHALQGVLASPAVRSIAREHGIDLETVPGSGKDGRISKGPPFSRLRPEHPLKCLLEPLQALMGKETPEEFCCVHSTISACGEVDAA